MPAFKIEAAMRSVLDVPSLVEWAGATASALADRIADLEREQVKLAVLLRELAERTGIAPPAHVVASRRVTKAYSGPHARAPRPFRPKLKGAP